MVEPTIIFENHESKVISRKLKLITELLQFHENESHE